jgi:hypothetical protein
MDDSKIAQLALVIKTPGLYNKTFLKNVLEARIGIVAINEYHEKLKNNTLLDKDYKDLLTKYEIALSNQNVNLFKQVVLYLTGKVQSARILAAMEELGKSLNRDLKQRFIASVQAQVQQAQVQQAPVFQAQVQQAQAQQAPVFQAPEVPPIVPAPPQLIKSLLNRKRIIVPLKPQIIRIPISDLLRQR